MILNKKHHLKLFILPALIVTLLINFIPLLWIILISFQKLEASTFSKFLLAPLNGINNYINLFNMKHRLSLRFIHSMRNISVYLLFTIPATYILSMFFALFINKYKKYRKFLFLIIIIPFVTPDSVVYYVWRIMYYTDHGFVNQVLLALNIITKPIVWLYSEGQIWAVIIASIWKGVSLGTLILLSGLETIPDYIYDASRIDGAGPVSIFFKITFPLLKPVTGTFLITLFIWNFYAYNQFFILFGEILGALDIGDNIIVPAILIRIAGLNEFNYGIASAMCVVLLLIVLSVTVIYFKFQKREN